MERRLRTLGTSFDALLDGERVGSFEVDTDLTRGGTVAQLAGWADEGNHWVRPDLCGRGIGTWLFRHGHEWLRLAGTTRFVTYVVEADLDWQPDWRSELRYYQRHGMTVVNRTRRGWQRR